MDDQSLADALPALLLDVWGVRAARVKPLGGGMNSSTALVEVASDQFVAKWSNDVTSLVAGCAAAALIAGQGVSTGEPLRSMRGDLTVSLADGSLALLRHVPGRELAGEDARDQEWMALTLARAHTAGGPSQSSDSCPFLDEWLSPPSPVLAVAAWLPSALAEVRHEYAALPALTWTQLHTDPAPEAFIHDDDTGTTGLIDWSGSCRGPVLYDVASAVMYLGGPSLADTFLACYLEHGVLTTGELTWLDAFRRLRWAIQASYFASRIVEDNQTGIEDDPGHNEAAISRARRGLEECASTHPPVG